jgi:two-component system, NtrC family, sensor kinase
MATKKSTKKAKPRRPKVKRSVAEQAQTIAELRQQLAESLQREKTTAKERHEALEQQTATSEILRVISSSPTDLQPVFRTILANAVRLCEAENGAVFRFDGEVFRAIVAETRFTCIPGLCSEYADSPGTRKRAASSRP